MKNYILSLIFGCICFGLYSQTKKDSVYVFYFPSAQYTIAKDSAAKFSMFYKRFKSCTSCSFELKGFADSVGSIERNLKLSEKRIASVKKLLIATHQSQTLILPMGEKMSQKTKDNRLYRKVILHVKSSNSPQVLSKTTENTVKNEAEKTDSYKNKIAYHDSLDTPEKLKKAFETLYKPIRLKVNFALNSAELNSEVQSDLIVLAEYMKEHPTLKARLIGHVCCSNNYELSRGRSLEVKRFLIVNGIEAWRITCEGVGNTKPVVYEKDPETEAINRRVEVVFF